MTGVKKFCKHSNGVGHCELSGEYCVEGPCTKCEEVEYAEVVHGHKVIHNRPYAAQFIYVGDDGYGNITRRTDGTGVAIEISPATISNPIEYCSECGKRMDGIWQNFCDNCGARMSEGGE